MEPPDLSRARRVKPGPEAAALDHPLRSRLLMACARSERSLTELARELGQPLPKLHYHLGRLTECGLLKLSRIQARRGRPIRYYRAAAEAFLVSVADVGEFMGERLARELRRSLAEEANRRDLSLLHHLDEAGRFRVRLVDSEGRGRNSKSFEYWKVLRLSADQRRALAAEMGALITRYESLAESGGEAWLVHAAFAPKLED